MPRFVALGSDMHRALAEMPLTRQGVRFNPWTILLELLNDTRLSCRVDNNKLLIAMSHLGWVTPDNIMRQRPLFAKYLLSSGCLSTLPRFSTLLPDNITLPADEASAKFSGTDLTPSQLMSLCQMQWPRFIAQKYQQALSVQQLDAVPADQGRFEKQADWNRAWLSANLSMIELRAALKKRQVVFGGSMDDREQFQLLFRGAFESAPGLALNIIMCWGGEYSDILNPYSVGRLSETYFASPETAKQAIGQAWQMYDWLLYCNPQWPLPIELDADTPASQRRSQRVAHATSSHIFASLGAFDSWKEATQSLDRLYRLLRRKWAAESEGPNHSDRSQGAVQSLAASDQRLAERYIKLQSQHSSS
ncbi:hypothetical protein GGI12_002093 [Dipsacomyces acuminosporus]|nr:hypothetical protein GGI12_002093 [Dipsacomyces acuminosporus]